MVRFPTTRKYLEIPVLGAFRGHSGPFRGQSPPSVRSRPEGPKRTEFPAAPTHAARECGSVDALTSRAASTNRNLTAGRTEAPARTRPWRRTRASAAKAPASRERSRGQLRPLWELQGRRMRSAGIPRRTPSETRPGRLGRRSRCSIRSRRSKPSGRAWVTRTQAPCRRGGRGPARVTSACRAEPLAPHLSSGHGARVRHLRGQPGGGD